MLTSNTEESSSTLSSSVSVSIEAGFEYAGVSASTSVSST